MLQDDRSKLEDAAEQSRVLLSLMDLDGVKRKKRAALLADVGIMEGTWLHEFRVAKQGSSEDS